MRDKDSVNIKISLRFFPCLTYDKLKLKNPHN